MKVARDVFRGEVRRYLEENWDPRRFPEAAAHRWEPVAPVGAWHRTLQAARLVAPHYPAEYGGRGLGMAERVVVTEELVRIGAPGPGNVVGIGWVGPAILAHGTASQRHRLLEPTVAGDLLWCQLFSEPDAGSDLAAVSTRAERCGEEWMVNGVKIWSSGAGAADLGILLARTDAEALPHGGLTMFLVDMHQEGVEVRPIRQMTGESAFAEVRFADARVGADRVLGEVGGGWRVALTTLLHERLSLSTGRGLDWGAGPTFHDFWGLAVGGGSGWHRDRLVRLYVEHFVIDVMRRRVAEAVDGGTVPGLEAAVQKLMADELGRRVQDTALDLLGPSGMLLDGAGDGESGVWAQGFLFSPALTIGGGTASIQRNLLGERSLGLPGEPRWGRARQAERARS